MPIFPEGGRVWVWFVAPHSWMPLTAWSRVSDPLRPADPHSDPHLQPTRRPSRGPRPTEPTRSRTELAPAAAERGVQGLRAAATRGDPGFGDGDLGSREVGGSRGTGGTVGGRSWRTRTHCSWKAGNIWAINGNPLGIGCPGIGGRKERINDKSQRRRLGGSWGFGDNRAQIQRFHVFIAYYI